MSKSYSLITNAAELQQLHEEAKKKNKLEVGVSKGKRCYIWNEQTNNIQTISAEEAALRLNLTLEQVNLILESKGAIEFTDDIEKEHAAELEDEPIEEIEDEPIEEIEDEPIEEIELTPPVIETPAPDPKEEATPHAETKTIETPTEEPPALQEKARVEPKNEHPETDPKNALRREILDDAYELLQKIKSLCA